MSQTKAEAQAPKTKHVGYDREKAKEELKKVFKRGGLGYLTEDNSMTHGHMEWWGYRLIYWTPAQVRKAAEKSGNRNK